MNIISILKKIKNYLFINKHFIISLLILIFIFEFLLDRDFEIFSIFNNNLEYFIYFGILFEISLFFPMLKNHFLFKYSKVKTPFFMPLRLIYFSYLGDNIAMNIGGDITKFATYRKFFTLRKTIFFIIFDKITVLIIKLIIIYFLLFAFIYLNDFNFIKNFILISITSIILLYFILKILFKYLIKKKIRIWKLRSSYLSLFQNKLKKDKNLRKIFIVFFISTIFHQIYLCFLIFLICFHLDIPVSFISSSIIFLLLIVISRLPLSFSGFGIREFFSIVFFSVIGISSDIAFSASVFFGLIALFPMISSTLLYIYFKKIL